MTETTNNWNGLQWIALYVMPRSEKAVQVKLQQEGYECYLPLKREKRKWSDRMKMVETPWFPGYIFVRIGAKQYAAVRQFDGIVCAVCFGEKRTVALIREKEIEALRAFVASEIQKELVDALKLKKGAKVKINAGEFAGYEGNLVDNSDAGNFAIFISGISMAMVVSVDPLSLEVIEEEPKAKKTKTYHI